jgi:hypothetical protein
MRSESVVKADMFNSVGVARKRAENIAKAGGRIFHLAKYGGKWVVIYNPPAYRKSGRKKRV